LQTLHTFKSAPVTFEPLLKRSPLEYNN
jgi:hypothetical protein